MMFWYGLHALWKVFNPLCQLEGLVNHCMNITGIVFLFLCFRRYLELLTRWNFFQSVNIWSWNGTWKYILRENTRTSLTTYVKENIPLLVYDLSLQTVLPFFYLFCFRSRIRNWDKLLRSLFARFILSQSLLHLHEGFYCLWAALQSGGWIGWWQI